MSEKFVEKLTEAAGRRGFLKTLSAATAALALGLLNGRSASASGGPCGPSLFKVACCCLFKDPRTCVYSGCACQWSWTCSTGIGEDGGDTCRRYTCRECYSTGETNSDGVCIGTVKCSRATYSTIPCL